MNATKVVGCLVAMVLVAIAGVGGVWYFYLQTVEDSGLLFGVEFDQSTADCRSLLGSEAADAPVSTDRLTVWAKGPVATIDGEPVTDEQFHRFIDWFYEPESQPAARVPLDQIVEQAARFYAVKRTLDEAETTVSDRQLEAYADIVWEQFDSRADVDRYLDSVGLGKWELFVEGCRGMRLVNYLAAEDAFGLGRGAVKRLLRSRRASEPGSTTERVVKDGAIGYLRLKRASDHLPGSGSDRWATIFEAIETTPGNVRRADGAEEGPEPGSEAGESVVKASGDREGWSFLYPEHAIGGGEGPTRTLADLVAPADGGFTLEMTTRDIPRTLFVPELGLRAVGMAGQSRSAPARIDWNAEADPPTVDAVDIGGRPFASYSRGLAHMSVDTNEVEAVNPEEGERAAVRLVPTGWSLYPGATRSPFRIALRDAEGYADYLNGLECEDPGDASDHLDDEELTERLAEAEASGSCDGDLRETLTSQRAEAAESVAEVESLYREECATCHGEEGKGDGPAGGGLMPAPTNFHNADQWKQGRTPNDAFYVTTTGIDGTAMASYDSLSAGERWRLAYYVVEMLPEEKRADEPKATIEKMCRRLTARQTGFQAPCKPSKTEEGP